MEKTNRTKNSLINVSVGMASYVLITLVAFVNSRIFCDYIGLEIRGINGSFSEIIAMLSLTELGIGTAIIYHLYKPLANGDKRTIISLMQAYSKVYRIIILAVLGLALCVMPFLKFFIKEDYDYGFLVLAFGLMAAEVAVSYLLAYKRAIIEADQKGFYVKIIYAVITILSNAVQILILIFTKNFLLFLCVKIAFRLIENVLVTLLINKMYPYIRTNEKVPLEPKIKKSIIYTVKAVGLHYIGMYLINGCDQIVISSFIGTVTAGIYFNYRQIFIALRAFITQITQGILPSFGNMLVSKDRRGSHDVFMRAMFVNFVIVNFIAVSVITLINPFVKLWISHNALLSMSVVFVLVLNFYLEGLSEILGSLRASAGLFAPDRWLHIFLAILNLGLSIIWVQSIGIIGIFISTCICYTIKNILILPNIVYKNIFNMSVWLYYRKLILYILSTFMFGGITFYVAGLLQYGNNIVNLVLRAVVCLVIPNLLVAVCYSRTDEFKFFMKMVIGFKNKLLKKSV